MLGEDIERLAAILGPQHAVPKTGQAAREDVAVGLVVVDDEQRGRVPLPLPGGPSPAPG